MIPKPTVVCSKHQRRGLATTVHLMICGKWKRELFFLIVLFQTFKERRRKYAT